MKKQGVLRGLAFVLAISSTSRLHAQTTGYTVTARGADYKVLSKTTVEHGTNRLHQYTELATGLNYTNASGQWIESQEQITLLPQGGAAATQGRHKVYFPSDIYNGILEVVTPDGKHLKSRPLGVSFDDGSNSVWIAKLKHCTGYLVSSNKVLYPDAFTGVKADLICTYRRGGFESDLVFRQNPPSPLAYGLDDAASTLQMFTEFFNTPEPQQIPAADDPDYGISDTTLKFGKMTMTRGKAFLVYSDSTLQAPSSAVAVYKSWLHAEGRTFLVEQLPLEYLADELQTLPPSTNILTAQLTKDPVLFMAQAKRIFPPAQGIQADTNQMLMASVDLDKQLGVVLDYNAVDGGLMDYTFQAGITYFVNGYVGLSGAVIFENGAVLKYSQQGWLEVDANATLSYPSSLDQPVIFTSCNDDSVGDTIAGTSSGSPALGDVGNFINFNAASSTVRNCRFCWANSAIQNPNGDLDIWDSQFVDLGFAIVGNAISLHNVLIARMDDAAIYSYGNLAAENVTVVSAWSFVTMDYDYDIAIKNSLLACPNWLTGGGTPNLATQNVEFTVPESAFQAAVGAKYYLASDSQYRNAGTTNIDPVLLAELKTKTTYPPVVLTDQDLTHDIVFSPQVQRDTDAPDLGYHYAPIDYALGGVSLGGATATVQPGTIIGAFATATRPYGLNLGYGAQFICRGLATNWNRIIACNTVQEQGSTGPMHGLITDDAAGTTTLLDCRFTDWSVMAQANQLAISNHTSVILRDCQFRGGAVFLDYPGFGETSIGADFPLIASDPMLKNCLLERVNVVLSVADSSPTYVQNNLFLGGSFNYKPGSGDATVQNNFFDRTTIPDNSSVSGTYLGGYNACMTNYDRLQPASAYDLVLTNTVAYQSGPLGKYYQPANSPLLNAGSANANTLGLYDYTVLTNLVSGREIKEANSAVDIGYHYVTVDAAGNLLDADANGLADYLETSSTGVIPDWWEWKYFGNLNQAATVDYDSDGTNILSEYQHGVDPNKVSFSFSVPNQYVTTTTVTASITVFSGIPSRIAVLVDNTNLAGATWIAYSSSSITLNLGTNQGSHEVWIGLRGLPVDAQQTWQNTTLVLDSVLPTISITNPASNVSFNASRVNVSGNFTAGLLKQITLNGITAFVSGTSFEALNVPLSAGTNKITAIIEGLTGATNTAFINVIGITNLDGTINSLVQLLATPIAGVVPLTVTFQVQTNIPGTFQQALFDWNGDSIIDLVTNTLSSLAYTYATNGEYFPVVTIQTTAGRFSSVGGWNAVAVDPAEQPIRINVLPAFTQVTTISITDPVDIKWTGANLYVLSGSGRSIAMFDTNGTAIGSAFSFGVVPSGFDVDAAGNLYVALTASNQVWKFFPTNGSFVANTNFGMGGHIGLTNGTSGTDTNAFNAPWDVAVSPDGGTISVSDSGNHRIQQFSASKGAFNSSFGTNGSALGQFNTPKGLTYDSIGTLYIADSGNHRIVTANGSVLSATGTNGPALGQFNNPGNIGIGGRGVYVADASNNRIQKFDAPVHGTFSITPTTIRFGFATNFSGPKAVAAMNDYLEEKFWVADTGSNRVVLYKQAADDPLPVWISMTNRIAAGDIPGAIANFSVAAADKYQSAFLSLGTTNTISAIDQIGALAPAVIGTDTAQYYFERTVDGQVITFPVEFVKENGVWKILEF